MISRAGRKSKCLLAAGLTVYLLIIAKPFVNNDQLDLFIYRLGAKFALRGESPYDSPRFRAEVAQAFPPQRADDFALNCGFFLPPQALVLFAPLAALKWQAAEVCWFLILTLFGIGCGTLASTFGRDDANRRNGWVVIVLVLLLNPVTQLALIVGQTGLLVAGSIALGQYCFEKRHPYLGCFLWSLSFIKPHLALPFLILAGILGGWKRALGILIFVAAFNILGGLLAFGTFAGAIRLVGEYVEYLGSGHKAVLFNLVSENFQIVSWNRVVAALDGPNIDLDIGTTLAGYLFWGLLIVVRLLVARYRNGSATNRTLGFSRDRLDPAYLLAMTTVGALFFAQVIAYEMILLVLLAPWLLQRIDDGRRTDVCILIALLAFLAIPLTLMDRVADALRFDEQSLGRTLLRSHKCFGMAMLAIYLLLRGPTKTKHVLSS